MPDSSVAGQNNDSLDFTYQALQPHHLAHDLRGPLNSMLGFAELLLEGIEGPLNDIQQEDLSAIRQSAQNLLRLINAYVDLSRVDAGQLNIHLSPVKVADILSGATDVIKEFDASADVNYAAAIPETLPHLFADPDRAAQMVALPLEFLRPKVTTNAINISAQAGDSAVEIIIAAAGLTLTPEEQSELFEPTVRVDAGGRSKLTAGGIYLPLAHQLAQLHNGRLTVASSPETGVVFTLTLPMYRPD